MCDIIDKQPLTFDEIRELFESIVSDKAIKEKLNNSLQNLENLKQTLYSEGWNAEIEIVTSISPTSEILSENTIIGKKYGISILITKVKADDINNIVSEELEFNIYRYRHVNRMGINSGDYEGKGFGRLMIAILICKYHKCFSNISIIGICADASDGFWTHIGMKPNRFTVSREDFGEITRNSELSTATCGFDLDFTFSDLSKWAIGKTLGHTDVRTRDYTIRKTSSYIQPSIEKKTTLNRVKSAINKTFKKQKTKKNLTKLWFSKKKKRKKKKKTRKNKK